MWVAYSSNMETAIGSNYNGDFMSQPWKHMEWGNTLSTIFMGNVGTGDPFGPGIFHQWR